VYIVEYASYFFIDKNRQMSNQTDTAKIDMLIMTGKLGEANRLCQQLLAETPQDVPLIVLMARIFFQSNQYYRAIDLLLSKQKIEDPTQQITSLLIECWSKEENFTEILDIFKSLTNRERLPVSSKLCVGFAFQSLSDFFNAISVYESILKEDPKNYEVSIFLGNAYRYTGRVAQAIEQYYNCIQANSEYKYIAYFSLSNLKSFEFTSNDIEKMISLLDNEQPNNEHKVFLMFALGKAFEDKEEYKLAFVYYNKGNSIKNQSSRYNPELHFKFAKIVTSYFAKSPPPALTNGDTTEKPIFILGMPRSGSTLVEQILSSHSKVERMGEVPYIGKLVYAVREEMTGEYPTLLQNLTNDKILELRSRYINNCGSHRKQTRPLFIDKTPANFEHIGFIKTLFPEALIIDSRRDIKANAFSLFKQMFFKGQEYSYSIDKIQAYYSIYVYFMNQWNEIYSDQIYTVNYEILVDNFEEEVGNLLAYCGLEEETGCYRYFENNQTVDTASSEQVRKPIYKSAKLAWKNFESYFDDIAVMKID
jgi:tetratricopeptide (TPR) repeat protein